MVLNGSALLGLLVWPLLHPMALPTQALAVLVVAPAPPVVPRVRSVATQPAVGEAAPARLADSLAAPSHVPRVVALGSAPVVDMRLMGDGGPAFGVPNGLDRAGDGRPVHVVAGQASVGPGNRVAVSSGVMAGSRIGGMDPQYPAMAQAARVEGTIVLQATIAKSGAIENLRVVSGPALLAGAAVEAAKSWRYQPYLLNGEPVEVETQINVVFKLGN